MQLSSHQLLVQVKYSGLNRADLSQKAGNYPAPSGHSEILGLEVFGRVIAIGNAVHKFKIGDEILALVNGGGYATECIVEESIAIKKPDFLTDEESAAIPEVFMTSILNLVELGDLQKNQTILIHAGASGVGLAAIGLAKLIGATVIATVRNKSKVKACQDAGCDYVIVQDDKIDYDIQIKNLGLSVNLTLNPVGGKYINHDLECLSFGGKLINIGLMAGSDIEINLSLVLRKNLQLIGSTIRNKPNEIKARLARRLEELVLPALRAHKLKIVIDRVFSMSDVEAAHEYLASNKNTGKILLKR